MFISAIQNLKSVNIRWHFCRFLFLPLDQATHLLYFITQVSQVMMLMALVAGSGSLSMPDIFIQQVLILWIECPYPFINMNLNFQLAEECKVKLGPISRKCLLSFADKDKQKVAISDDSRRIFIYDATGKEFVEEFKSGDYDKQVTSMCISDDLIFFAVGSEVKAINRKGKEIYSFDTYFAESIKALLVHGYKLWVIGDTLLNEFDMAEPQLINNRSRKPQNNAQKTTQASYYMSEDPIMDSFMYFESTGKAFCVILRKNFQIQMIDKGENIAFLKTDGMPTCCSPPTVKQTSQTNLIGLSSGSVICMQTTTTGPKKIFRKLFEISQTANKVINVIDLPKGVLVCRASQLQIWSKGQGESGETGFELHWQKPTSEALVDCIYLEQNDEIVYCTFTGKVISVADMEKQLHRGKAVKKEDDQRKIKQQLEKQIQALQAENDKLNAAQASKIGNKLKKYRINHTVDLNPASKSYVFSISSSLPITKAVFQGNVNIKTDKEVMFEENDQKTGISKTIIKIEDEMGPSFEYYAKEGAQNSLTCYLFLRGAKEIVYVTNVEIKALCLHTKIDNKIPAQFKNKSTLNKLTLTGRFNKTDLNSWLTSCFEALKSLPQDQVSLMYESLSTKQKLACQFKDQECVFLAESLQPLLVLRKVMMRKAKERELALKVKFEPNAASVEETLKILEPKILECEKLQKACKILPGLIEISAQQNGMDSLSAKFKQILENQKKIKEDYEKCLRIYQEIKDSLMEIYKGFQAAKQVQISEFQKENFMKRLADFKMEEIKSLIIS